MILISDNLSTSPSESASFDRSIQAQTIWFFMLNWLVHTGKRSGVWKVIVQKHFAMRREEILRTVKQWMRQNPDLGIWTGHLTNRGMPKLGPTKEYVPSFHSNRSINLLESLERNLPSTFGARL